LIRLLQVREVFSGYGETEILHGVSIAVDKGEIVTIIGPNGSGKSTIIKALSHIISPRSGRVLVDRRDINSIPRRELARLVGVVPQLPLLPSTFTAFEIVLMGRNPHLGLFQSEGRHDWDMARQAMEKTGTRELAERHVNELSGGEIQCLLIARVLVQDTRAILLDEPTANLDIGRQAEVLDLIKRLCARNRLAVLAAIHDLNLAAQYCDRLLLIKDRRIHAEGRPAEVITNENIRAVYGAGNCVYPHPANGLPTVLLGAHLYRTGNDTGK